MRVSNMQQNKKPTVSNHILAFIIMMGLTILICFIYNIWFIIGLLLLIVIFHAYGYGVSAIFGFIAGVLFSYLAIFIKLIAFANNPFHGIFG